MSMLNEKEFKIVIPKYDNSDRKIKPSLIKGYAKKMYIRFEGVSIIPSVLGCWVSKKKKKVFCEENIIMSSNRDFNGISDKEKKKTIAKDRRFIKNIAKDIGKKLGQKAVMTGEDNVEVSFHSGKYKRELGKRKLGQDWFEKLI